MPTEFQLGQLIAFKNEGYSGWVVQQKLSQIDCKISINQINNIYNQWKKFRGQKYPETRGRKKLFNEELIEQIKNRIRNQRTITAVDIWRSKTPNPNEMAIIIAGFKSN
ncbi:hypothetical protein ABPG72_007727 [Tetrahymena utriculariae]